MNTLITAWNLARDRDRQGPTPGPQEEGFQGKLQRAKERERQDRGASRKVVRTHQHNVILNLLCLHPWGVLGAPYICQQRCSQALSVAQAGRSVVVVWGGCCPASLLTGLCVFSWGLR